LCHQLCQLCIWLADDPISVHKSVLRLGMSPAVKSLLDVICDVRKKKKKSSLSHAGINAIIRSTWHELTD